SPMVHLANKDHLLPESGFRYDLLDLVAIHAVAHKQESDAALLRQHRDRFGECQYAVPWPKRAHKTRQGLMFGDAKFAANSFSAGSRSKLFDVNSIRVDDDFFTRHSDGDQIVSLNPGDDEDPRGGSQIQEFAPLEQIDHPHAAPVPGHPDLRAVVLQK